jgi:hypothetical protein
MVANMPNPTPVCFHVFGKLLSTRKHTCTSKTERALATRIWHDFGTFSLVGEKFLEHS